MAYARCIRKFCFNVSTLTTNCTLMEEVVKSKVKTPKSKRLSIRETPDGNSTKKKGVAKIKRVDDTTFTKSPAIKKQKRSPGPDNDDVTPKKKKKENLKSDDVAWEADVHGKRGDPDGAATSSVKKASKKSPKSEGGKGTAEKKPRKPLQNIKSAAHKLKTFSSKEKKGGLKKDGKDSDDSKRTKLFEMKKKDRKEFRKATKNNYELAKQSKKMWEEIRCTNCKPKRREELCDELYKLVKGKSSELVLAHDTARIFQCLMKFGTPAQRQILFDETKDHILVMMKNKYAKFFVRKLLKYGNKSHRNFVFKTLHGKTRKLLRHSDAAELVELCYNDYANATQRKAMLQEFYGPAFILYKENDASTLAEIKDQVKRDSILSDMKEFLLPLIEKNILVHTIVHRIFMEFFSFCNTQMRTDMIEALRENLVHILHTRDGSRVALKCLWHGTAKDRKIIVKSFKTHVAKICKEEYGHLVLLGLFDCVDDTKIVTKVIIEEMLKSVHEIAFDQYGRKVLLYLLAARDPLYFHPDIVSILSQGDDNTTSKKIPEVRRKELQEAVSPPLLQYICDHVKELVMNNSAILLLLAILKHTQGDPTKAMEAVAQIAAEPFTPGNLENFHIIEHPAGHITLKKLISNDKEHLEKDPDAVSFSRVLVDNLPAGSLKSWAACNRGCFILVNLIELEDDVVTAAVVKEIEPMKKSLPKSGFKGAQILLSKLKGK